MTTRLFTTLKEVAGVLRDLETNWALVGGLAVSAYVEPRFTRDIDIAVSVEDDADAEELIRSWSAHGYVVHSLVEQEATGRLATARSHRPKAEHGIVVDLLFASSGIESEVASQARELELAPGLRLPVARPGHLFGLKLLSVDSERRPLDVIDLKALAATLDAEELTAAREAVGLIEERGYNRGRDLNAAFDEYLPQGL